MGLIPAIIAGIILFALNPILGVLWVVWVVGVGVYAWKKK
jgi:hypothetical protein